MFLKNPVEKNRSKADSHSLILSNTQPFPNRSRGVVMERAEKVWRP